MGNSDSKGDKEELNASGDIEDQKKGAGEEEHKGTPPDEETKSRPGGAVEPGSAAASAASESEPDSDDDIDEEERAARAKVNIQQYEYHPEQVEELIMISGMTEAEINKLFKRFFMATKMSKDPARMKRKVFLKLPEIAVNPLKHRLAHVFGFNDPAHKSGINFGTFVQKLAIFSERGSKQDKLKASFQMYDLDNTNRISRQNLKDVVGMLVDLGVPQTEKQREEQEEVLKIAVDKVFLEASSHKDLEYLSFEDYRAIVLETDFQAKLMIHLF